MRQRLSDWIRRARSLDLLLLAAVLLVVAAGWFFVEVLDEVHEGDVRWFDEWTLRTIGGWDAPAWLEEIGRDVTALGGVFVLGVVSLAVAGYLLIDGKRHALAFLAIAVIGGMVLSFVLKGVIDRPRPDLVLHRSYVMTQSFPSGHAMLSAVVYLTLGTMLARLTKRRLLRAYFIGVAMLLSGLVGVSRVFLGVHWPTDVLAGWSAGLVWAMGCWATARWLQRRGKVEPAD